MASKDFNQLGCIEESIIVNKETLLYSMSNNLDDIEIAVFTRTGFNVNLKIISWRKNKVLLNKVKHLMNKHQIMYSMTITGRKQLMINMRVNDGWLLSGFTEIDGEYYHWDLLETAEAIKKIIRKKIEKKVEKKINEKEIKKVEDKKEEKYSVDLKNKENLTIGRLFHNIWLQFKKRKDNEISYDAFLTNIKDLIKNNIQLEFCQKIKSFELDDNDNLLLICFCHYFVNHNDNYIGFNELKYFYEDKSIVHSILKSISEGSHFLIKNKYLERNSRDYYLDSETWKLSDKIKKDILPEFYQKNINDKKTDIILYDNIKEKTMIYNTKENEAIKTLFNLLQEENYQKILERLNAKGMRKGFTCIFSGYPGTGKTETVFQIARETKRNIMKVDISGTKSMWFGESEKNIKEIFNNYRKAMEGAEHTPILLLNEAEAVIGKRIEFKDGSRSIDKTENRIQNIILEEMENFSGILIATTNLTQNMDSAFERRFLYKINFDRPSIESRKGIWNALLPDITEEISTKLSGRFELSGGQIENIARKVEVNSILNGSDPTIDTLVQYCIDENKNDYESIKNYIL